ncbi:MAG: radical SAM family heme chaperone HemW [Ferruginibacter sp.]
MPGIYIHIPFCRQACTYCNFHFSTSLALKGKVINAINHEIFLCEPFSADEEINTIYFGGGTPSLLTESELNSILESLHKKFNIAQEAEITLEANPDNINKSELTEWKRTGINRLSLGVQSFMEEELKWMNRAHTTVQSMQSIDEIILAGFNNFSVDLIYGSPLLTDADLKKHVDIIVNKKVPHISCYALTVEPKTALDKMIRKNESLPVNNDKQSDQFLMLMQWMRDAGYEHYEISNFCLPGMRSKHNSSYWKGIPYYGFGPSAHSFNGKNIRRWNIANNALYIQSLEKDSIPFTEEVLTKTQQLNEYIMIGLRTMEGIQLSEIELRFGSTVSNRLLQNSERFINNKLMILKNNALVVTQQGKLLADGIAGDLFDLD